MQPHQWHTFNVNIQRLAKGTLLSCQRQVAGSLTGAAILPIHCLTFF